MLGGTGLKHFSTRNNNLLSPKDKKQFHILVLLQKIYNAEIQQGKVYNIKDP
jgi:hypothetical protein